MTVKLFVALHGGASYAAPDTAIEYRSLEAAAQDWADRRDHQHTRHFDAEHNEFVFCPCWGDPSVYGQTNDGRYHAGMAWYVNDDHPAVRQGPVGLLLDTCDMYPDRELTVGPRGGLRWERC